MKMIDEHNYNSIWSRACIAIEESKSLTGEIGINKQIVEKALSRRNPKTGMRETDVAILLQVVRASNNNELKDVILKSARTLRHKLFSNKISVMVPIEVSSYCMSNCKFCGWRSDNKLIPRLMISKEALMKQTEFLSKQGFSHFEIASGDDLNYIKNNLLEAVSLVKNISKKHNSQSRVSICVTPLLEPHYKTLKENGLDAVLNWQETYSRETFHEHVVSGPKANGITIDYKVARDGDGYLARIKAQEYAVRSGLQVGIGAMIGLDRNPEVDILSTVIHGFLLINSYQEILQPLIIGMPTWNPITTSENDKRGEYPAVINIEESFELISAIYLLAFPDNFAWIFPNCRVSKKTQIDSVVTAGCFTSTMVRVGPGAYLKEIDIEKDFSRKNTLGINLDREGILKGEQFVHHYHEHSSYLDSFAKRGLSVVSDKTFLRVADAR